MKIGSYNDTPFVEHSNDGKKNNKPDSNKEMSKITSTAAQNPDRLEISGDIRKLNLIRENIESGFYDSSEVLNKVAKKINSTI